jgi:hypothetical protein
MNTRQINEISADNPNYYDVELEKFKLPTSAKNNKDKNGKKIPMTLFQAESLYNTAIDIKTFQRIAQTYYKTSRINQLISLTNEQTGNSIQICFTRDMFKYIRCTKYITSRPYPDNQIEILIKKPEFNSLLFQKLISNRYI